MEERGERRHGVGTRSTNLAHHIDLNAANGAERYLHLHGAIAQALINRCERTAQTLGCLGNGKSAHIDRAEIRNKDLSVGSDGGLLGHLRIAPHVDDNLIASSQDIVIRRCEAQVRLEGKTTA